MYIARKQAGMNLLELVLAIVLLSLGAVSIVAVVMQSSRPQFNPLLQQQSLYIAQAYLAEILSKPLNDPQDSEQGLHLLEEGEHGRRDYDDVLDYSNLTDIPLSDHAGNIVNSLDHYEVAVRFKNTRMGNNHTPMWRIQIDVTQVAHPMNTTHLVVYRGAR